MRPEIVLMSVKNFRTFIIHSRNQIVGGFDVDRLCHFFLSSIEWTILFFRQTQPFLKSFCKNIFECFRENLREKVEKLRPERREVLIVTRKKPQDHPSQSQLSTRNVVEAHVKHFGKPDAYGFVTFFKKSWMIKTWTGHHEEQQLWQTEAIFQHQKTIVRI